MDIMEVKMLKPGILSEWTIKGTKEKPRLYNIYTMETIILGDTDILEYITLCNGTNTLLEISKIVGEDIETVYGFYEKFASKGVVVYNKGKCDIDISLGNSEPWLREVHIDITSKCNLRCTHCFWGDNIGLYSNIQFDKWKRFIGDVKKSGVGKVILSGGEFFTSKDSLRFVHEIVTNKLTLAAIFTNGTIWNKNVEDVLSYISKNDLTTTFYISLDGRNDEEHGYIRGAGTYDKTISFIKKLIDYRKTSGGRYGVVVNSLIHKKNCTRLVEWYTQLADLGVDRWRFTSGRVEGGLKKNGADIQVKTQDVYEEYLELINHVSYLSGKDELRMHINIESFFSSHMLQSKRMYIFDENLNVCEYKRNGCSIDPLGNMQVCTSWQRKKYGNIFEEELEKVWHESGIQKIKGMKIKEIVGCRSCKYLKYCGGGCREEAGALNEKDEYICDNYRVFAEKIIPKLKALGIKELV